MKVKGIELMQMIADGKIKDGTRINIIDDCNPYRFYTIVGYYRCLRIWREEIGKEDVLLERVLDTEDLLNKTFEILEDKTEEIECINAYNLIEAPYMAKCLDKNNHTEFMELLKQSELELVDKIEKLTKTVNKLNKQDTSKETNCMSE